MKAKIFFILLICSFCVFGQNSKIVKPYFTFDLPENYYKVNSTDQYNLLTAQKELNNEIVGMIEIKFSDDWSFALFSNEEYISEMVKSDKIITAASTILNNLKVISKEKIYLKGVGDCFSIVYAGDLYNNNVRVIYFLVQFVKNKNLFTMIGSSFPYNFTSEYKRFLKSFDSFQL